ncbi:MAG: DNA-methyltransferase [Caldisphaera sp.]
MYGEEKHKLLVGDCLEVMPQLDTKFDACITDPPYNISGYDNKKVIGWLKTNTFWEKEKKFKKLDEHWDKFTNEDYEKFTEKWLAKICDVVKPNGNIIIFGTYHNIYLIGSLLQKMNKKIINSIVWYKRNAFPNITHRMLCESTEYIIWAVNNDPKNAKNWTFNYDVLKGLNYGKQMRNVWDIPLTPVKEKKYGKHPTQKPLKLIERLVLGFTKPGDYIIDPFVGSGTVPVACKLHGRFSVGIDIDENYLRIAEKRLKEIKYQKLIDVYG